jgi:hypothetical protein
VILIVLLFHHAAEIRAQSGNPDAGQPGEPPPQTTGDLKSGASPPWIIRALDPQRIFAWNNIPAGPYTAPDGRQRFQFYLRENFTRPSAAAMPFFSAIGKEIRNQPPQWDGWTGYLQRTGSRAIFQLTSKSLDSAVSAMAGYDTRYYPCYCSGVWRRIGHALLFQVLTVDRNGHRVIDFPRIGGSYLGEMAAATPYPGPYDVRAALRNGNGFFYWGWWYNLVSEFSPDISRWIRRHWSKPKAPALP